MSSDSEKCAHWLGKLANLNAANAPGLGIAPHKPLMIFSVMDLIEMGVLRDQWVVYDADLVTRFRDYWDHVVERRRNLPEITMPFNALGGERFDEHGNPSKSKLTTRLCHLDPDLHDCLLTPDFRLSARRVLIATYFTPPEQVSLCARFGLPVPDAAEMTAFAPMSVHSISSPAPSPDTPSIARAATSSKPAISTNMRRAATTIHATASL